MARNLDRALRREVNRRDPDPEIVASILAVTPTRSNRNFPGVNHDSLRRLEELRSDPVYLANLVAKPALDQTVQPPQPAVETYHPDQV